MDYSKTVAVETKWETKERKHGHVNGHATIVCTEQLRQRGRRKTKKKKTHWGTYNRETVHTQADAITVIWGILSVRRRPTRDH